MSVPQQGLLSRVGFTSVFRPTREWSVVQDEDHVTLSPPRLQPYKPEYVGHLKTHFLSWKKLLSGLHCCYISNTLSYMHTFFNKDVQASSLRIAAMHFGKCRA